MQRISNFFDPLSKVFGIFSVQSGELRDGVQAAILVKHLMAWASMAVSMYIPGAQSGILQALIVLVIIDFITGVYRALWVTKNFSTRGLRQGVAKLFIYAALVIMGNVLGTLSFAGIKYTAIPELILSYLSFTEGYSILDNLKQISKQYGLHLPIIEFLQKKICTEESPLGVVSKGLKKGRGHDAQTDKSSPGNDKAAK